jgi:hypothetical protein
MIKKFLFICGCIAIAIPIIFYLSIAIGMVSTASSKPIKLDCVDQYKKTIKEKFSDINNVKIYYRQGRLHFDIDGNPEMSLDECKKVVQEIRDFVEKDTTAQPLRDMIDESQLSISIKFDLNTNIYSFEHSYYDYDNPNVRGTNSYKNWHMEINKEETIHIEL